MIYEIRLSMFIHSNSWWCCCPVLAGLPQHEGKFSLEPELPVISTEDLPWLVGTDAARKARFKFWKRTLERSSALKWLLVNSFPDESKLELANNKKFTACRRVLPIGPICNCRNDELRKSVSFWEEDMSCLKWLEKQKAKSVVYISFGSWVSPIGEAKWHSRLQGGLSFGYWGPLGAKAYRLGFWKGLWSSKAEAWPWSFLGHHRIRFCSITLWLCYITHCGWNSILEALQFQKKLLCYPVVNSAYVVQVWRVGLKLNIGLEPKDVEEALVRFIQDKEMDTRLRIFNQRIMGGNNNKTGTLMLKTFLQDLNKARSTTTWIISPCSSLSRPSPINLLFLFLKAL